MTPWLDWFDTKLSANEIARDLGPTRTAWSHQLLSITMITAVAYPVVTVITQWLSGAAITFGGATVLEAGALQARIFVAVWLGSSFFLYLLSVNFRSGWRTALFIAATLILCAGLLSSSTFDVPRAVAIAIGFAFVGAVAVAVAGAVAVAVAGAVAFAVAGAVAFTVAFAVAGAVAVAVAGAVAVAVAFAVAGAVAVAVAVAVEKRDKKLGSHPKRNLCLIAIYIATLTLAVYFGRFDTETAMADSAFFILFLGIFPLFNMLADFASIGLTRFLLRQGIQGMSWWKAMIDLFGGAIIFFCLGCALITWMHLVKSGGTISLMDLDGLFAGLRHSPSDYWWLAIMLATTLLPTLLHAAIGIFTCLITYPAPLRAWVVNGLTSGSATAGWRASLAICAMISLSLWVPLIAFYLVVTFDKGLLRNSVITIFETYARAIGAI